MVIIGTNHKYLLKFRFRERRISKRTHFSKKTEPTADKHTAGLPYDGERQSACPPGAGLTDQT